MDVLNVNAKKMQVTLDPVTSEKTYTVTDLLPARGFNERNYLLPIPQSEIERNKNMEQNPGYN
jgi:SusD family.